ncbi:hypothetical protein [Streptomyces sp. NPDC001292]|uniref:hypothetical protein n=1 Tax=Streptomyces sp. NPDC001292 TaxID=3364558 RepID=UPI0036AF1D35
MITIQCGPIRHEIEDASAFDKHLVVHPTTYTTDETGTDGASIQAIYNELAHHHARNQLIAADIADAARRGRCSRRAGRRRAEPGAARGGAARELNHVEMRRAEPVHGWKSTRG